MDALSTPDNAQSDACVAVDSSGLSMAHEALATNLVANDGNAASNIFMLADEALSFWMFDDSFEG